MYTLMHNSAINTLQPFYQEYAVEPTKVGIREFRSGLAEYIASETPVTVTRHGQTVGVFIPTPTPSQADLQAFVEASEALDKVLAQHPPLDIEQVMVDFKALRKAGKVDTATGRATSKKHVRA